MSQLVLTLEGTGFVIKAPDKLSDEIHLEIHAPSHSIPTQCTDLFSVQGLWDSTRFDRMRNAMRKFASDRQCVSSFLYDSILGHHDHPPTLEFKIPISDRYLLPRELLRSDSLLSICPS